MSVPGVHVNADSERLETQLDDILRLDVQDTRQCLQICSHIQERLDLSRCHAYIGHTGFS
jgi:hypothetical protein